MVLDVTVVVLFPCSASAKSLSPAARRAFSARPACFATYARARTTATTRKGAATMATMPADLLSPACWEQVSPSSLRAVHTPCLIAATMIMVMAAHPPQLATAHEKPAHASTVIDAALGFGLAGAAFLSVAGALGSWSDAVPSVTVDFSSDDAMMVRGGGPAAEFLENNR